MTAVFPIHPDDMDQLIKIRRYLIGFRATNGWSQPELSQRINGTNGIAWDLEYNKRLQWRFSRLQGWVQAFDLYLEAQLRFPADPDLEERVQIHPEVAPFLALGQGGHNWPSWQRMALTASLTVARKEQGIGTDEMANRLGITRKAVNNWEALAGQIMLPKILHHARMLDGHITLRLRGDQAP